MNALVDRVSAVLSGLSGKRSSTGYPAYLKWIGAAALLIAAGVIVKASLTHIFVQGNCCADDGYFSLIAKTFVASFQYGLPISDREVHAFHASIGSGPALILPGALAIALFGPQNWVPGLTAFAMLTVQLAAFAWLLSKVYDKWRVAMFMGVALLVIVATTRFHFYYMVYIGEGPALGFLLLGIACLVLQQTRPRYVYIAGLMFSLALLTKVIEAFTIAGALGVWFAYRLSAVRWRAFADAARLSAAFLAPFLLYEAIKFASLGADGYVLHWQTFSAVSDKLHSRPEDVSAAVARLFGEQYLLTWGSALFVAAMLGAGVYCFVRSRERALALLPLMLFAAAGLHLAYSIFVSSLSPRYFWPGIMVLNFAIASPFLLLGARASAVAFVALLAMFATPMSIADYARFHDSYLRRQTLEERRVVLDFIAARSEAPVVSQWWGSFFEIAYLMDEGQRWRLTNNARDVGDIDGPVVLNSHFMDRNAFHAAVSASCERHNPELTLYELYVCKGRYLPSASGLGEALEIRSVDLDGAAGVRGWHAGAGAPPSDPRAGWGTYTRQGDAGVGRVSLSVTVAPDVREIAVPLITGPVAEGVIFRVLGEDGGEIAVLAAPADASGWRLWRIEMAPAARLRQLRIEVEDRGADWGQWAALGAPRAIGALRSAQGHRAVSLDELVASAVGGAQHAAQLIEEPGPSGVPTPAVFAHAPMDLSASIGPGARELVVNFGMRARSYASSPGTKGVCFSADARLASGAVRQLWRRCLTPVEATGDRGMQEAAVAIPEGAQRIVFRTRPAVNGDLTWAWAYWAAPRVR